MKFSVEVPDEIVVAARDNDISRREMARRFGISEQKARIYQSAIRTGTLVHVEQPKIDVASGTTVKALLLPDIHWPYHDKKAIDAAVNYGLKIGCSVVVVQGDGFDCYYVSRFKKDPLRPSFPRERVISRGMFEDFTGQLGDSIRRKIFLCGNHEERIQNYIWEHAPAFADVGALSVQSLYGITDAGWEFVSNKELKRAGCRPFRLGKCYIFHGHEIGMSGGAKNFARLHYLKDPVNQINAHHHQEDSAKFTKSSGEMDGSWTLGCLCRLSPEYSAFNQWGHGFGVVEWDADGDFRVTQRPIIGGVVH